MLTWDMAWRVVMRRQAVLFKKAVSSGGYSKIDETLNSIRSERARATVQDDEDSIKLVIKESLAGGFQSLDNMIRAHLLEWFHSAGAVQVASRLSRAPQAWSNSGNSRSVSRSQSKSRSIEASSVSREPADVDSKTLPKPYESNRVRPDRSGPRGASSLSKEPEIAEVVATPEDIFGVDKSNIGSKVYKRNRLGCVVRVILSMTKTPCRAYLCVVCCPHFPSSTFAQSGYSAATAKSRVILSVIIRVQTSTSWHCDLSFVFS
eukprot:m.1615188 g.1615188  ORF g.1615188 m.1615188 type:complete len:262 (-) comp25371_c2_seq5:2279-3064(-)